MSTVITTINSSDLITNSRTDINNNFASLNTNKIETSVIDTDTTLSANSDSKVPSQKAVKAYIDAGGDPTLLQHQVPTGAILPYGGSSAPTYYLLCNGNAISRTTYSALFAAIGISYGSGDGSTTFNLPDGRNRSPIGAGSATKVATFVSRSSNVITVSGLTSAANNEFQTGRDVVYHTTGTVITGLVNDTTYYVIRISNTTFSLASTLANAIAGTTISLSSDGTGTQTFTYTFTTRSVGDYGGEENHAQVIAEMPAHTHAIVAGTSDGGTGTVVKASTNTNISNTNSTGGSALMNILNPFFGSNYIIKI